MQNHRFDLGGWELISDDTGVSAPVLVHNGRAYGPSDLDGMPAHRVAAWAYVQIRTNDVLDIEQKVSVAHRFLQQWPQGPQIDLSQLSTTTVGGTLDLAAPGVAEA